MIKQDKLWIRLKLLILTNKVIKRPSKTGDLVTTNLQITWKYRN